jgi:hypothetical protein
MRAGRALLGDKTASGANRRHRACLFFNNLASASPGATFQPTSPLLRMAPRLPAADNNLRSVPRTGRHAAGPAASGPAWLADETVDNRGWPDTGRQGDAMLKRLVGKKCGDPNCANSGELVPADLNVCDTCAEPLLPVKEWNRGLDIDALRPFAGRSRCRDVIHSSTAATLLCTATAPPARNHIGVLFRDR